jgi:ABC-type spermidine/putrescine transport system permease subunit I
MDGIVVAVIVFIVCVALGVLAALFSAARDERRDDE